MRDITLPKNRFGLVDEYSLIYWDVEEIWKLTENTKIETISISEIMKSDMNKNLIKRYNDNIEDAFIIEKANIKYPVIAQRVNGLIHLVDGYHRLAKLINLNKETIEVKFIDKLPKAFYLHGKRIIHPCYNFNWDAKYKFTYKESRNINLIFTYRDY